MQVKLVEPWWDDMRNPITGMKTGSHDTRGHRQVSEELKYYDAYPTLEIKNKH